MQYPLFITIYWFIFHISDREQLTDRPLAPTFYLGNCPYCSRRGFHLFSYFTFISGEQTVLFDPRRRMVLAGISSCVHGHRQSGTFKRLMLTFHIVYLLKHISQFIHFLVKKSAIISCCHAAVSWYEICCGQFHPNCG